MKTLENTCFYRDYGQSNMLKVKRKAEFMTNAGLLYRMYMSDSIDYPLYKALSIVVSYNLSYHDMQRELHNSNGATSNMRYKTLWGNFKLWYQRSGVALPFMLLLKINRHCKNKTFFNVNIPLVLSVKGV